MSDVKCAVCGEPWDYYGARTGDMTWWEYDLFRRGAGCPCCEGKATCDPDEALEAHLRSVVFGGTDDPDSFVRLHDPRKPAIKWKPPTPRVVWKCAGCGLSVVESLDRPANDDPSSPTWLEWHGAVYSRRLGNPEAKPPWTIDGEMFCDRCAGTCEECGEPIVIASACKSPESTSYMNPDWICEDCICVVEDRVQREAAHEGLDYVLWKHDIDPDEDLKSPLSHFDLKEAFWDWLGRHYPDRQEYCEGGNSPSQVEVEKFLLEIGYEL